MNKRRLLETKLLNLTQQFLYQTGIGIRKVQLNISLQKHLGLSSLDRLELFSEIEKEFQFHFTDEMFAKIDTLRDVTDILSSKIPPLQEYYSIPKSQKHSVDPEKAQTLTELLMLYAHKEAERPHIFFQGKEGEVIITYGEILQNALTVAHGLLEMGGEPGQKVAMMLPNHPSFFYVFFGILLAGFIPIPLEPLLDEKNLSHCMEANSSKFIQISSAIFITFIESTSFNERLRKIVPDVKKVVPADTLLKSKPIGLIMPRKSSNLALNGITHRDLLLSIPSYGKKLHLTNEDIAVSWAPLYRRPGLMGLWLSCFYYGIPLVLMSTYDFFKQPERWLWAIHYSNATISVGDRLIYELCIQKINPAQLEGLDLHSWRIALHMGETIPQEILDKFTQKFSHYGFRKESFSSVSGFTEPPIDLSCLPQMQTFAKEHPAYEQPVRSSWNRPIEALRIFLRLLYTAYAAALFLLDLLLLYCCSWVLPSKAVAHLVHISVRVLLALIFCRIEVHNKQKFSKKAILVANHASYMDALLFLSILPPTVKIAAKEELASWPLVGKLMQKIGCIFVARAEFPKGTQESIHAMEEALKHNSILIFPEGTFTYARGLRPFRLGAFKVACASNTPVIPIAVQGTRSCLRDLTYLLRPAALKVFIGPTIQPKGKHYNDEIAIRKEAKEFIAQHCGEPVLNLIVAGKAVPDLPEPSFYE
jgi:1-acyl-sn-glycerol-3-phosphate acyltransferase